MIIQYQTNTKHIPSTTPKKTFPTYTQNVARFLLISSANTNDVIRVQSNYEYVDNNTLNKHV